MPMTLVVNAAFVNNDPMHSVPLNTMFPSAMIVLATPINLIALPISLSILTICYIVGPGSQLDYNSTPKLLDSSIASHCNSKD